HLPFEVKSVSFNMPCVVLASKSGATSLIRGILLSLIVPPGIWSRKLAARVVFRKSDRNRLANGASGPDEPLLQANVSKPWHESARYVARRGQNSNPQPAVSDQIN